MRHTALFYGTAREFLDSTVRFVRGGLAADEAVLVTLPGPHVDLLHTALGPLAEDVQFIDMFELGRNPARIIPQIRAFLDPVAGTRSRFVGEPFWPERTSAEARETARHEALLNVALADARLSVLCAYDWTRLDEDVLGDAGRTHPELVVRGERRPSVLYPAPPTANDGLGGPLPPPPPDAPLLQFTRSDLPSLVEVIWRAGTLLDLPTDRVRDLMYAASEVAMNTFKHGGGDGELRLWQDSEHRGLVCEVRDRGVLRDPFAGRRDPAASQLCTNSPRAGADSGAGLGRGLWLANQHCDLVEIRSDRCGTTVRLHLRP